MKARITVTLKAGILDPQGKAIEGALTSLGLEGVASVRQGKVFDVEFDGATEAADEVLRSACDRLLANTVVENYQIVWDEGSAPTMAPAPGTASPGAMQEAAADADMPLEGNL